MKLSWTVCQIGQEPSVRELVEQYADEMKRLDFYQCWSNSDVFHCSAILVNGMPISAMFFAPIYSEREIHCSGAYTVPAWRRAGIYNELWIQTVNMWRLEDKFDGLWSGFNNRNDISRAMQAKQDREILLVTDEATRTFTSLKPTGDEWQHTNEALTKMFDLVDTRVEQLNGVV